MKGNSSKIRMKGVFHQYTKQMAVIGDNIIVHGTNAYALYLLTPHNYNVSSNAVNEIRVEKILSMIESLSTVIKDVTFSIYKSSFILGADKKIQALIDTCKKWRDGEPALPLAFTNGINSTIVDNNLIAIKLNLVNTKDVEEMGFKDIVSNIYSAGTALILNEREALKNMEKLTATEKRIRRHISRYAKPVNRELLVSTYLRAVFPNYNLYVNKLDVKSTNMILNKIQQRFDPYFGYFRMTNEGVNMFGADPIETYGSVIMIKEFPTEIYSGDMNLDIGGAKTTIRVLSKSEARKRFGRVRADLEFEAKNAAIVNARDTEEIDEGLDLVEQALKGRNTICEFNSLITLVDSDYDRLKERRTRLLSELREINIIAMPAPDQAKAYIDNYISMAENDFFHMADLRYPLSFQYDSGSMFGDFDSKFSAPEIGSTL